MGGSHLAPFLQQRKNIAYAGALSWLTLGLDVTAVDFDYGLPSHLRAPGSHPEAAPSGKSVRREGGAITMRVRAESIRSTAEFVASSSEVRVIFPIDGDGFFTHDRSVDELGTSPPAPSAG